jgi:lyso-ornithine lipid O-acyltransferase
MARLTFVTVSFFTMTGGLFAILWLLATLRLPGRRWVGRAYFRLLAKLLRTRIRVVGAPAESWAALLVANHVSWLDIPVIGASIPTVFVAKREIGGWPVIGHGAKLMRTVFVDRARRQQTGGATAEIASRLAEGDSVVLFAEGTSSDGNRVLPFRSALVGAANEVLEQLGPEAHVVVQPMSICYTGLQGLPMGRQHRPVVAWYGDLDFVPHLKEYIRRGAVDAVVTFGEPIVYGARADRKELTRTLENTVRRMTAQALRGSAALGAGDSMGKALRKSGRMPANTDS